MGGEHNPWLLAAARCPVARRQPSEVYERGSFGEDSCCGCCAAAAQEAEEGT